MNVVEELAALRIVNALNTEVSLVYKALNFQNIQMVLRMGEMI